MMTKSDFISGDYRSQAKHSNETPGKSNQTCAYSYRQFTACHSRKVKEQVARASSSSVKYYITPGSIPNKFPLRFLVTLPTGDMQSINYPHTKVLAHADGYPKRINKSDNRHTGDCLKS